MNHLVNNTTMGLSEESTIWAGFRGGGGGGTLISVPCSISWSGLTRERRIYFQDDSLIWLASGSRLASASLVGAKGQGPQFLLTVSPAWASSQCGGWVLKVSQKAQSGRCHFLRPDPRIWHSIREPRFKVSNLELLSKGRVSKNSWVEF